MSQVNNKKLIMVSGIALIAVVLAIAGQVESCRRERRLDMARITIANLLRLYPELASEANQPSGQNQNRPNQNGQQQPNSNNNGQQQQQQMPNNQNQNQVIPNNNNQQIPSGNQNQQGGQGQQGQQAQPVVPDNAN